jgi:hypothetical protein
VDQLTGADKPLTVDAGGALDEGPQQAVRTGVEAGADPRLTATWTTRVPLAGTARTDRRRAAVGTYRILSNRPCPCQGQRGTGLFRRSPPAPIAKAW